MSILAADDPATCPRRYLVAALRGVGPQAPTLCEGWQARHLAAHIVVREGALLPLLGAAIQRRDPARELGNEVDTLAQYEALVDRIEAGPGRLSPHRWLPGLRQGNVAEFLIHALDVRRGGEAEGKRAEGKQSPPDQGPALGPRLAGALWASVGLMGRLRYLRGCPVGVIAVVPGGPRRVLRRGPSSVVLTGSELELALVVSGRERASRAVLSGPPEAMARFTAAGLWPGETGA